ncbi:hypothetical protein [Methanobacterium formicicum]|uniref:Uncharacterized protein n=1 Tax=Methanobacterium formicicum (strain DSM 3637 / PP1) TaxID=1204725 RepID=K2QDJ8_METFP|nr:hypothetical protein [Methanobacterium formicicum]EKF86111.1 hypothetical protein A994_04125 [Methanobacterium formicicum DSM 3637]
MEEQFLVKSLMKDDYVEEDHLLLLVTDLIEEYVLTKIINEFKDEDVDYLKVKDRQLRWLAAKARFRAVKIK